MHLPFAVGAAAVLLALGVLARAKDALDAADATESHSAADPMNQAQAVTVGDA